MKRGSYPTLVAVCLTLTLLSGAAWSGALPWLEPGSRPTLAPMLKRVTPAVVNVATKARVRVNSPLLTDPFFRHFFGVPNAPQERESQSLGSGVIVDAKGGYVLTNHHVIEGADEITVTLQDRRKFTAKVVGMDPDSDLAVLKIPAEDLVQVELGDSDKLEVGDFVVAIGSPFGLSQTVTSGIVSGLGRSGLGIEGYEDFIQTDASINPGNSGGALVDLDGNLIGVNTAIVAPSGGNVGIGFAIPINMARVVTEQLVKFGEVRRGQLGVHVQDLTQELARALNTDITQGAVVARVLKGSPAEKAGLQVGDVIVAVHGRPVSDADDLRNAVGLMRVGERIELDILRRGKQRTVTAKVGEPELTRVEGTRISRFLDGALLAEPDQGGVTIAEIERNSTAWQAGLRQGDVIESANRQAVTTLEDLRAAVGRERNGLLLNIRRGDAAMFILIR
jgi:Do/DeqQ family serine protease